MDLFKIIIIDDECLIAESLAELVNYADYSFEISGCFEDAQNALEYMRENPVDVVISDIKMKDISGIDLLKTIKTEYPETEVVLISAYRDFEYARIALSYKAFEYLTKPISYKEYTNTLNRLRETLENKREKNISFGEKNARVKGVDKIICDYFNDVIDEDSFINSMQKRQISKEMLKSYCYLYRLKIKDFDKYTSDVWVYGGDRLFSAIRQIIPYSYHNCTIFSILNESGTIQLIIVSMQGEDDSNTKNVIEYIKNEIYSILTLEVDLYISNKAPSMILLKHDMKKSIEYLANTLISHIVNDEFEQVRCLGEKIFKTMSIEEQREFCILLNKFLEKFCCENKEFVPIDEVSINSISNSYTLSMYFDEILGVLNKEEDKELPQKIILDIVRYINKNYSKDITLSSVASQAMMNYSYFSSFFKKYTGDTFSSFLLKVRMEHAAELLKKNQNMSIQVICEEVGYKSLPYFYKEFRAYTGYSPGEYREK